MPEGPHSLYPTNTTGHTSSGRCSGLPGEAGWAGERGRGALGQHHSERRLSAPQPGGWANPICKWEYSLEGEVPGLSTLHLLTNLGSPGEPWADALGTYSLKAGIYPLSSVQSLSRSDSLRPHEPQHARSSCPSPTPGVYPDPCPLSQWCHPTISSSVVPFSSCPQSFPASGSFQVSQLFTSGGQSIGVSASASVLPMNTQDWSALGWTHWISLQSKRLSKTLLQHHSSKTSILKKKKISSLALGFLYSPTLTSIQD